ncbi:MAG: tyrosine-type recombinase/integrase [Acidaminococcaceae bacterium]
MDNNQELKAMLQQVLNNQAQSTGRKEGQRVNFNEYIDEWLESKKIVLAVGTYDKYESLVRIHIKPYFESRYLQDITIKELQEFFNQKAERYSPSTLRELKSSILHQVFHEAVGRDLVEKNLTEFINIPQVEQKSAKPLTPEEVRRLLTAAEGHYSYIGIAIMLYTGIRRGEMLALTWDNVNLEAGELWICKSYSPTRSKGAILKSPKTKRSVRCVPLCQSLVSLLQALRTQSSGDVYVCRQKRHDKMIAPRVFDRSVELLSEKAGIEGISSHSFRHTAATTMFESGVATRTIADNLGHTTTRMLDTHYIHLRPNSLQMESAKALEGAYGDVLNTTVKAS